MNFEDRFTGRAVGDFLVGLPSQLALTSYTVMDQGQDMQFYFLQDDFRVTPRLTLNLGLRYEFATPPREKNNALANFDPATGTMVFAKDGSLYDRALIHPDRNNFAPRVGIRLCAGGPLGRARRLRHVLQPHRAAGPRRDARLQPAVPRGQPAVDVRQRIGGGGVGGAVSTQQGLPGRPARRRRRCRQPSRGAPRIPIRRRRPFISTTWAFSTS